MGGEILRETAKRSPPKTDSRILFQVFWKNHLNAGRRVSAEVNAKDNVKRERGGWVGGEVGEVPELVAR